MPIDPDNVRVDLLKIKRKLYISYPEGSKERHDFLFASKLSELNYLQKLVNPDVVDAVFGEYNKRWKFEILAIVLCTLIGLCFSIMLFGYHQLNPTNQWLTFYKLPFFFGLGGSGTHIYHLVKHWNQFKPFRAEYEVLKDKIEKLVNEIKGLAK